MAEAEGGNRATQHIPMQSKGCYSDLLQRFIDGSESKTKLEEAMKDTEEIELSLGLSLNGRFGVDPKAMKLTRSSSISNFMNHPVRDEDTTCLVQVTRTCSLPTETQEEWRKRKALQSLRRMVAKRKRTEKLRNSGVFRDRVCLGDNCEEGKRGDDKGLIPINGNHQQDYVHNRVSGPRGGGFSANGFESKAESAAGMEGLPKASSQGSLGSQGSGGSSGISEFESQSIQGMNKCTEARSPASVQSLPEQGEQKPVVTPGTTTTEKSDKFSGIAMENPSKKLTVPENEAEGIVRNVMEEMPCVSTRGDGPNGKRIEGFLYRYRMGEELRIVCVCHGSFLSPAEFVKHAGGGDVAHPLRHIVVNPSSLL